MDMGLPRWRFGLVFVAWCGCLAGSIGRADEAARDRGIVLLVPGMAWNVAEPHCAWGECEKDPSGTDRWNGLIGFLDGRGYSYGGTLRANRAKFNLPEDLDTRGARGEPSEARLFMLAFSPSANTDGLAHKGLELAEAVRQLCRFTGAKKVMLVGHSAGGLVARAYLQGSLVGVPYRGDVDRLITIATPHLGAALASNIGDLLGTRATSIGVDAPMIVALNRELELPPDVRFASIVVRGFSADVRGKGSAYAGTVDAERIARLPVDYREGGDQVVHVVTQNLRLARCAAEYEQRTRRPVQYLLARVEDPSHVPGGLRVHDAAPSDPAVQEMVLELLEEDFFWNAAESEKRSALMERQARLHAMGAIEAAVLDDHSGSEVKEIQLDGFRCEGRRADTWRSTFDGRARSVNRVMPLRRRWTQVRGVLELEFDRFGRVTGADVDIKRRKDL